MNYILLTIAVLWELPQNILGLAYMIIHRKKIIKKEIIHNRLFLGVNVFSISLGHFIYYSKDGWANPEEIAAGKAHEYGHAIQSMILGPLYLLIIGIPSLARFYYDLWYYSHHKKPWGKYYNGFPENWAERLGTRFFKKNNS